MTLIDQKFDCIHTYLILLIFAIHHQEFVKAVDAWRNRGAASTSIATDSDGAKVTHTGSVPVKNSMGGASAAALAMAAKISTDLEVEQQLFKKRMSEQREVLQASIKQNEEMSMKLVGDSMLSEENSSLRENHKQSDKRSHEPNMNVQVQVDDDDEDSGYYNESKNESKQVKRAVTAREGSPRQLEGDSDTRGKSLSRELRRES